MNVKQYLWCVILSTLLCTFNGIAQTRSTNPDFFSDPRGEPELTICSQNLQNYGALSNVRERVKEATQESLNDKEKDLLKRFVAAKCDVIAVQEIVAKNEVEGEAVLQHIALLLRRRTGRFFDTRAGGAIDGSLRVGFLVAKDRAEILNTTSYAKVELPKLLPYEKPRFFARGPLEIQLEVKPQGEGIKKSVTLVTFHFKSRATGSKDPSGLEWETYRLEEAEALQRILQTRHERAFKSGETILVVLGDRNSDFDRASARVLQGSVTLKSFQERGVCRLSKKGVALCTKNAFGPETLFSVLLLDPETKQRTGTFVHDGVYNWLDDILMPLESLRYAGASYDTTGNYDSGVLYEPVEASDHALVYTRLNW